MAHVLCQALLHGCVASVIHINPWATLGCGGVGAKAQRGWETCRRSQFLREWRSPRSSVRSCLGPKAVLPLLLLPDSQRLELHIWLPNDPRPPGGKGKAWGHCCKGRGAGGVWAERRAGLLPRAGGLRPSLGRQGAELPSLLLPAAAERQCASH